MQPRDGDFSDVERPALPDVPGMITEAEGRFLYWLTRETALGGAVVEVGTWLGRSTVHLAAGLRDAGLPGRLHAYDRFVWLPDQAHQAPDLPLRPGQSFEPVFRRFVETVDPGVHVHRADLGEIVWDAGPIDVLFLDAPKRWSEVWSALRTFGSHLVPGRSLLVFQDYLFPLSPEIALAMDRLRDRTARVHAVTPGGTVSFRVDRPLAEEDLREPPLESLDPAEVGAAWERILAALPGEARALLEPGLGALLFQMGRMDEAVRAVRAQAARGIGIEMWKGQAAFVSNYRSLRPLFHALELHRPDWDLLIEREERALARLERKRAEVERLRARIRALERGSLQGLLRRAVRRLRRVRAASAGR